MWQVQALVAQDRIREQMAEADRARLIAIDQEWAAVRSARVRRARKPQEDVTDLRPAGIARS
jgi:hypothetical protein